MNPFKLALALVDDFAQAGARLSVLPEGICPSVDVSESLEGRLTALCGAGDARQGLLTNRALRAVILARSRAARELLTLAVEHTSGLPVPFTVRFARTSASGAATTVCLCSTERGTFEEATKAGVPTFLLRELEAAALAAEQGRATPVEFDRWLAAKRARPDWRVTPETVGLLEHVQRDEREALCWGELLEALGCALVDVELHAKEAA